MAMNMFTPSLCLLMILARGCYGSDTPCTTINGKCQIDNLLCTGEYKSGHCSGASNRRCCAPVTGSDSSCWATGGTCQENSITCPGTYRTGLCAGGTTRKCCDLSNVPGSCNAVNIITRSVWGARDAASETSLSLPVGKFFVHHTAGLSCIDQTDCSSKVRSTQNYHMDVKGWDDIGYNFLAGEDGNIYEGRGWANQGAHTSSYNAVSIGLSFLGTFTTNAPGSPAIMAAKNLLACGVPGSKLTSTYKLHGHRNAGQTACPGNALYALIKTWPKFSSNV